MSFFFLSSDQLKQGDFFSSGRACTYALSATTHAETPQNVDSENTHTSLTMVEYAIKVLEDDEHFNAGHFF
jgi:isoaspartyl peptidase/L-asparaginase-like protein (Ntn-hydrolase superfamily)